ncbi:autoinducer binding domain-containing protein [Tropicimonas sp. S265A]|uniref:autoinducer binding domain-containing protein n=1 Tax=Tropicimonas sp. S265A TaxID=3415134 RepID=UPI003C7B74BB
MISGHLSALIAKSSIEEVWALHCAQMAQYGFDRLLYGFTRFRTASSYGDRKDALILSNHDPEYLEQFFAEDLVRNAPMVQWSEQNSGACCWSYIDDLERSGLLSKGALKVLELNRKFDVTAGVTISFKDIAVGGFGAIGMAAVKGTTQAQVQAIWDKHGRDLLLSNNIVHLRALTLPSPNRNRLTERQREVLQWVANGKTIHEVSEVIGRKPATVEKHLRLAREAMNAETTAQAVLKASVQNQIFLDTLR